MKLGDIFGRLTGRGAIRASYDAAKARRRLSGWQPSTASARTLLQTDGALMRARARDVIRNNAHAASACESFKANLIGAGIKPSSLIADPDKRDEVMKLWLAWTDEADADGLADFYGMQSVIARALFEAGEIFVRFRARKPGDMDTVPLQLQLLEADMLDLTFTETADNGNPIINGVEFDLIGRRTAYWFWAAHPGDMAIMPTGFPGQRVRVPASEVLHVFRPERPGQIRGVPIVAPAIVRLWLLDQYDDAELDRKKIAAMYAGFITSPAPEDLLADNIDDPAANDGNVTLEPGTMQALLPGENITFSSPAEVGGSYEAFQYRNLLAVFSAMGVPYTLGTGDLKRANYSSLRGAIVEYRRRLEQIQHQVMVFQFCRPVWRRWMHEAVFSGELKLPGYVRDAAPFLAAKWIPPKFEWVDPYKDRNAELLAVKSGFKSRSDVIEEEGYDPEETDRRIAADRAREKDLGLIFDSNTAAPAEVAAMVAADGPADPADTADQGDQAAA